MAEKKKPTRHPLKNFLAIKCPLMSSGFLAKKAKVMPMAIGIANWAMKVR